MLELLANLIRFAPIVAVVLSLAGGALGSGAVAWNIQQWRFDTFEAPRIRQAQKEADVAEFERIAAAAKAAADLKTFKAIEAATNHYESQRQEDAAWEQARTDLNKLETEEYERRIALARREGCYFDQLDLDYLDGRILQPSGPTSRGRSN
jgi:hypothetical protein